MIAFKRYALVSESKKQTLELNLLKSIAMMLIYSVSVGGWCLVTRSYVITAWSAVYKHKRPRPKLRTYMDSYLAWLCIMNLPPDTELHAMWTWCVMRYSMLVSGAGQATSIRNNCRSRGITITCIEAAECTCFEVEITLAAR